jgi:hypothetical protein
LIQLYKSQIIKILSGTSLIFLFWLFCFHWTDPHEVGITRNFFSGTLELDSVGGFNITAPWIQVTKIDIRPTRVCISSSTKNFNCRLVQFQKEYYKEFIESEGFKYYWWCNRISFNTGHNEEYRGMRDVLRGYAFDKNSRKFITIIEELQ